MKPASTAALLEQIEEEIDSLLQIDADRLRSCIQQIEKRTRAGQPADRLSAQLRQLHRQAQSRLAHRLKSPLKLDYPSPLPISSRRAEIIETIQAHPVVIICGTTGSGKTTQLPKMALEAGFGQRGRIGVTQPRRLAATSMARRVAEETGVPYGKGVGSQVRFDDQSGDETRIKFMTDGILLAETASDPHLLQYDCLIIDEAHERSLNIDFILGYLKNLIQERPDLKIIISSATLDAEAFSTFFGDAPVLEVEGRTYPVEDHFMPPEEDEELADQVLRAIEWMSSMDDRGDLLVFLPGEREIRDVEKKLKGQRWNHTEILPLFGRLSAGEQQRVFKQGTKRRVVLATNVAETSITIPGIRYVIDSGLVRLSRYNPRKQVQGLQVEQVSQASARQRRGRCGRERDGICIFLYDRETLSNSPAFTDPEIRRTSLAGTILQMGLLNLPPIDRFPLIDPPQSTLIREGYKTLQDIGAVNARRQITPLGRDIARFPVDPHLARMLIQARDEGALQEGLILVAFLSIQDVRERPAEQADAADRAHAQWREPRSDFITILNLWNAIEEARREEGSTTRLRKFCKSRFINYRRVIEWNHLYRDLCDTVRQLKWKLPKERRYKETHYDLIHRSLLAGIPTQIGRKGEGHEYGGTRSRRFFIFPGSSLFGNPPSWVMSFTLIETTRLYARMCAAIEPEWVHAVAPHLCKCVHTQPEWDAEQGFVYARESILSGGLTLAAGRRVHYGSVNPAEAHRIFIREGVVPGKIKTSVKGYLPHAEMLNEIKQLEERIRRPGTLLDFEAVFHHFDHLIPKEVCSTVALEQWLRKEKVTLDLPIEQALFPEAQKVTDTDYPDELTFFENSYPLIYTFDPGNELDGCALICPSEQIATLPLWVAEWTIPGWMAEKVRYLLKSLPKNLRTSLMPMEKTAERFVQSIGAPEDALTALLSTWLQQEYRLPVDAADFDLSALPEYLTLKVIETRGDDVVHIHTALSEDHHSDARRVGIEAELQRWRLPSEKKWPGEELPEWISVGTEPGKKAYPALTDEAAGVGRAAFLSPVHAAYSHSAGLARLFRMEHADQVIYVEKHIPLDPGVQLMLTSLDPDFMQELIDAALIEALTDHRHLDIRTPELFAERAAAARGLLYEEAADGADVLKTLLEQRSRIVDGLEGLSCDYEILHDMEMQLAFLFRPGFLRTADLFSRYPRYLKALEIRIERIRNNEAADALKMQEIEPFQHRLTEKLLEADRIAEAYDLLEFALLLEEFRINRFAPEVKTPMRISAKRLDEAWPTCMEYHAS